MNYFTITPYIISLFIIIFLLVVVISISATDIVVEALSSATMTSGIFKYSNLVVVSVCYALLAIITIFITCYRFLNTRRMLHRISKRHIPKNDLPKKVLVKVQNGFQLARHIIQTIKPLSSDINHPGWPNPDNIDFQGVDMKRAVTRTPIIIESAATSISETYARPSFVDIRQYINFLIRQEIVDKTIGLIYLDGYEKARFSKYGPTEKEYMYIMKHLAAIINQMGYYLHQKISTHFTEQRGDLDQNIIRETGNRNRRSASSYWNRNNSPVYSTNYGHNGLQRMRRLHSIPDDDDVVSLAQSVATWSSQQQSHLVPGFDGNPNEGYDERLRHIIYERLMKPPI